MRPSFLSGLCLIVAATVLPQVVQDGALGPLLAASLTDQGVSPSLVGLILAAPWITIALTARMVPWAYRAAGPAALMSFAALASAVCLVLYPVSATPSMWLVLGGALGVLMAMRWIAGEAWLLLAAPVGMRGRLIGLQEMLVGLAGTVGPLLLIATGTGGATPFLACAGILAVSALLPLAAGRLVRTDAVGPSSPSDGSRMRGILVPMTAAALGGASEVAAHAFLPTVLETRLPPMLDPILAASLFSLGGTAIQLPFGWLVDRHDPSHVLPVLVVLLGLGGVLYPLVPAGLPVLVLTVALGAVCGCFYTLATVLMARSSGAAGFAVGIGALAMTNTVGSVAGPMVMGVLIDVLGAREGLGGALAVMATAGGLAPAIARAFTSMRKPR